MKRKSPLIAAAVAIVCISACQDGEKNESKKLANEAIEIHDEIMPKMGHFDRTTIRIDSILTNNEVTSTDPTTDSITKQSNTALIALKDNIEQATDFMNDWMRNYNPDSTDVAYQETEVESVNKMRDKFLKVEQEIEQVFPKNHR